MDAALEQTLTHLGPRFREALLETIPCAIFLLDDRQRVLYANPMAQQITGYEADEIIGKTCESLSMMFRVEGDPEVLKTMCPFGRSVWDEQCEIRRKDGRVLPVVRKAQPVQDSGGKVIGAIQILVDVSVLNQARSEIASLRQQIAATGRYGDLIGSSPQMRALYEAIDLVAGTDASVVIQGETGTGKELIARTIHARSRRSEAIFLAVNCGALPENLIEAELFGHVRGAFTGAAADRAGRFEEADGGTLLLDEIGELPPAAQVKLLRVLQEGEVTRVGESRPRKVDVRILAATHRDLAAEAGAGRFRMDLYYRLNVVLLKAPALRQRREDIPDLVRHFTGEMNAKYARAVRGFDAAAMQLLLAHPWPGNIRQLQHAIEHAFVLSDPKRTTLGLEALPAEMRQQAAPAEGAPSAATAEPADEAARVRAALEAAEGNKTRAAAMLGITRAGLYKKLRRLGIDAG